MVWRQQCGAWMRSGRILPRKRNRLCSTTRAMAPGNRGASRVSKEMQRIPGSVVIPTYRREEVLVATVESLLRQEPAPAEILVVDQTPEHVPEVARRLETLNELGRIRWLRLDRPSITHAMNAGLEAARSEVVLF